MKKEENVKITVVNKENYDYFKDLEETIFSLYDIVKFQQNEIRILYIVTFLLFLMLVFG